MLRAMIRWTVHVSQVEVETRLLAELYEEMARLQPDGLSYDTYVLEDGVTFVAIAEMRDGLGVLGTVPAFQRYRRDLEARCEHPPVVTVLQPTGIYRHP